MPFQTSFPGAHGASPHVSAGAGGLTFPHVGSLVRTTLCAPSTLGRSQKNSWCFQPSSSAQTRSACVYQRSYTTSPFVKSICSTEISQRCVFPLGGDFGYG